MPKKYLTIVQQYAVRQMLAEKVTMNMIAMHLRMSEKFLATEIERLNLDKPPENKKGASRYGQEARTLFARRKGAVCMTASANTACPQNKDKLPDRSSHITTPIRINK